MLGLIFKALLLQTMSSFLVDVVLVRDAQTIRGRCLLTGHTGDMHPQGKMLRCCAAVRGRRSSGFIYTLPADRLGITARTAGSPSFVVFN